MPLPRLRGATPETGRGALTANAPAWLGAQTQSMTGAFAGAVTRERLVNLKSSVWMPLPQAVPPGPQPRSAQGSWAHGPTMGGAVFVQLPQLGRLFALRQRNELPIPFGNANLGPGSTTAMTSQRGPSATSSSRAPVTRGLKNWKKGPGGKWVTATPFVVPTWNVLGTGGSTGSSTATTGS